MSKEIDSSFKAAKDALKNPSVDEAAEKGVEKGTEKSLAKSTVKTVGKTLGRANPLIDAYFVSKDIKQKKFATAATDAVGMIPGVGLVGTAAATGLQMTGVTDKLDKQISKGLKPGSAVSSKYPGSHKMEKAGKDAAKAGKNNIGIAKKMMDGYQHMGKGTAKTAVAIGAALYAILTGILAPTKQASMTKHLDGPTL